MIKYYKLNKETGDITEFKDIMEWAEWFEVTENRIIGKYRLPDGSVVSTVFIGMSPIAFSGEGENMFETMVFDSGTELDGEPFRYNTLKEAEEGHKEIIKKLKSIKNI